VHVHRAVQHLGPRPGHVDSANAAGMRAMTPGDHRLTAAPGLECAWPRAAAVENQ
jgi:hypothetical protein